MNTCVLNKLFIPSFVLTCPSQIARYELLIALSVIVIQKTLLDPKCFNHAILICMWDYFHSMSVNLWHHATYWGAVWALVAPCVLPLEHLKVLSCQHCPNLEILAYHSSFQILGWKQILYYRLKPEWDTRSGYFQTDLMKNGLVTKFTPALAQ